jgi:beta-N-acetylhexosaminidase
LQSYTDKTTLEEQIGQLLVVGFSGTTVPQTLRDLIERYHIGGIILFSRNIRNSQQTLELTRCLQAIAKASGQRYPLFIMLDQENGLVRRLGQGATIFPGNMALGATASEQMAYDIAQATGRELRALGITMNLAPVVDVNDNPSNPVIGVRSFGEHPQEVARLAVATVKGYQAAGVISTLKHFPGHGNTSVDSHQALPILPHTLERLEQVELVPFKRCIDAGAESVMIAHIYFPQLMPSAALPATISPAIVQGLLRQHLGFKGMIISDCMEMKAVSRTIGTEQGTVLALQAGIDLVLVSHHYQQQVGSLEAVQTAIKAGELSPETIRQAAERVLSLKERALTWDTDTSVTVPNLVGGKVHQQLRDAAYALSTTLVRNDEALIPLHIQSDERILVLYPQQTGASEAEDKGHSSASLAESIRQRHPNTRASAFSPNISETERTTILHGVAESSLIVMATLNAHMDAQQAELMRQLLQSGRRIVGIAIRNPYDLLAFPELRTYLATYEYTPPALEAAVRVLFGEIEARGHLPVGLGGLYDVSHQ